MMNIETDGDYEEAQRKFIHNAAKAIKPDGYLYIDFSLYINPKNDPTKTSNSNEWIIFQGTDDKGIKGKFSMCTGGTFDENTQMNYGKRRIDLVLHDEKEYTYEFIVNKRIPTLIDVEKWLKENNFTVEQIYGNYNKEPISESTNRAIIYAKKKRKLHITRL